MRIWYIHQYFRTPEQGGAIRSYYLATRLAEMGHEVHLICAHKEKTYRAEHQHGLQLHYLPVAYQQNMGLASRSKAFRGFIRSVLSWAAAQTQTPDGVYATSTPLTVGYLAYRLRRRYALPYVFEVRDLWPDVPLQMLPGLRLLAPVLRYWERKIYRTSEGIVALSPPMETAIRARARHTPITVVPNMADRTQFRPRTPNQAWRKRWQVPEGHRTIVYTGSMGQANAPETIIQCIQHTLATKLPVHWILAAEGSHLYRVKEVFQDHPSVTFVPILAKGDIAYLLAGADMALVTFLETVPVLGTNSPNKLFDALAAGCAVLTNRPGWYTDAVVTANAGHQITPESISEIVGRLLHSPKDLQKQQQNARQLSESFDREALTDHWIAFLEQLNWLRA